MFFQNILPLHGLHGSNKLHRHIQIISLDGVDSLPTLIMNTSFGPLSKELGKEKLISLLRFSHIHGEMGSGISRITEACTKAGLPIPTWASDGYSVIVTFKRSSQINGANDGAKSGANDGAKSGANNGANDGAKLAERQLAIINLVKANPQVSLNEIATSLGVGTTTIDREISKMKSVLKRVGPKFGGHWEILG